MTPAQQLQATIKALTTTTNRVTSNVAPGVFVDFLKVANTTDADCVIIISIISAEEEENTLGLESLCRLADSAGCAMQLIVEKKHFTGKHKLPIGQLRKMFRFFGFKKFNAYVWNDCCKRLPQPV